MLVKMPSLEFTTASDLIKNDYTIFVKEKVKYQQIDGFGASLTDSSAWLLNYRLAEAKRNQVIEQLFASSKPATSDNRQL